MLTIQIHDEQLARRLQEIAERENRPVEAILKVLVDQYPTPAQPDRPNHEDPRKRIRRKAYMKARQYWQEAGDSIKAAMTDEELDEQFGAFDEEGIPRLKSELKLSEPPIGSLAYAAKLIREQGGVRTEGSLDVTTSDEILNDEFADYLLRRMRGEDADK